MERVQREEWEDLGLNLENKWEISLGFVKDLNVDFG